MLGNCKSAGCVRDVREEGRNRGGELEEDPAIVVEALRNKAGGRAYATGVGLSSGKLGENESRTAW